jgi:hypothetical protein
MQKIPNTLDEFFEIDFNVYSVIDKKNRQQVIAYEAQDYLHHPTKVFFLNNGLCIKCSHTKIESYNEMIIYGHPFNSFHRWNNTFVNYAFEAGYYKHNLHNKNNVYFKTAQYSKLNVSHENLIKFLKSTNEFHVSWQDKIFESWLDLLAAIREQHPIEEILKKEKYCLNEKNQKYLKSKIISLVSLKECLFLVALHHQNINYIKEYSKHNEIKTLANKYIKSNKNRHHLFSQKKFYEYLVDLEILNIINFNEICTSLTINYHNQNESFLNSLYESIKLDKALKEKNTINKRNKL